MTMEGRLESAVKALQQMKSLDCRDRLTTIRCRCLRAAHCNCSAGAMTHAMLLIYWIGTRIATNICTFEGLLGQKIWAVLRDDNFYNFVVCMKMIIDGAVRMPSEGL